jgi:type IX secretion system PorP/SprF family membrane protein
MSRRNYLWVKILLAFVLSGMLRPASAQQLPLSNFQMQNLYLWNPAYTSESVLNAHLANRQQWVGTEGAPRTSILTANMPLSKKTGVGANFVLDRTDIFKQFYFTGSYSYEFRLGQANYLRFGVAMGFHQVSVDYKDIVIDNYSDPVFVAGTRSSGTSFTSDFGMNYRFRKWNFALAANQMIAGKQRFIVQGAEHRFAPVKHWMGYLSYKVSSFYNDDWAAVPALMVRTLSKSQFQIDFSVVASYQKHFYFGVGFREKDALRLISKVQIDRYFAAGYTYDFTSMGASRNSGGSHEIMLSFTYNKPKAEVVPVAKYVAPTVVNSRRAEDATITRRREPLKVFGEAGYHVIFGQFRDEPSARALSEELTGNEIEHKVVMSNLGTWFVLAPSVFTTKETRLAYTTTLDQGSILYSWRFVAQ